MIVSLIINVYSTMIYLTERCRFVQAFRSIFCFGAFAAASASASAITLPVGQSAASSQPVGVRAGDESTPRKFITLAGNNHHGFQRQTVHVSYMFALNRCYILK